MASFTASLRTFPRDDPTLPDIPIQLTAAAVVNSMAASLYALAAYEASAKVEYQPATTHVKERLLRLLHLS